MNEVLDVYEQETAEMVAVNVGKRKQRTRKYAWEQEFPEDLKKPGKEDQPQSARKRGGANKDKR